MHLFRKLVTILALVLGIADQSAAQESPANEWRIEDATATPVPSVQQYADGRLIMRSPRRTNNYLELRGTLMVEGDGSFGPISLTDAALLSGATAVPAAAELVAIGVHGGAESKCVYLRPPIGANETRIKLRAGGEMAIVREAGRADTLFLKMRAPTLNLCMVFELLEIPRAPLLWSFANRATPLTIGLPAAVEQTTMPATDNDTAAPRPASVPLSPATPQARQRAISSPLLWGGLALTAVALLGAFSLQRMRRQLADGSSSVAASTPHIPRVDSTHQPTSFARVEAEAGPGQQQFHDAMAELRLARFAEAGDLFGAALAEGLTPTFEAGAWSLRGEAMLGSHDLVGAMTCFLRSLSCPGATTESALPAATQLAAIYRELGLKQDAARMENVKTAINPFADEINPQRQAHIASLASELKRQKRARMVGIFMPWRKPR